MLRLFGFFKKNGLITLALAIHLSFYISYIFQTDSWIYPAGYYHNNYKGLDFFQIPKAAASFFRTQTFSAEIDDFWGDRIIRSNRNVYHPFLVVVLGIPLQFFSPEVAFEFWVVFKAILWLLGGFYLWRNYRDHPYGQWALFFFMAHFALGLEIRIGQFQELLNLCLMFALLSWFKGMTVKFNILYALSLLIKPVALLWLPLFLIRRHYKIVGFGVLMVALVTIPFFWRNCISYYFDNIYMRFNTKTIFGAPDIMSLNAFLKSLGGSPEALFSIKIFLVLAMMILAFIRRISIFTLFYILCLTSIFFDVYIYEYHFTLLIPFFVAGILYVPSMQRPLAIFLMIWAGLPSAYGLFRMIGSPHIVGGMPDEYLWQWMVTLKLLPICFLAIYLLLFDIIHPSSIKQVRYIP